MIIDEGTYRARARKDSATFGVSSKKGTEYVSAQFVIAPDEPFEGRSVPWTGWMTEKAMDRTLESLKMCGWDGVDIERLGPLDREVDIVVRHEVDERTGEVREARVAFINEVGSGPMGRSMDKGQLRSLAQRIKARQGRPAAANSRVSFGGDEPEAEPAPPPAPDPVNEPDPDQERGRTLDDIPF